MTNNKLADERIAQIYAECEERDPAIVEIRAMIAELQERRKAERDSEPVAEVRAYYPLGIDGGKQKFVQVTGELPEFGAKLYAAPQPAPEKYNIGDATMRHIFTPTGMTDVSNMQAVFDRVEAVLVGIEQPAPVNGSGIRSQRQPPSRR